MSVICVMFWERASMNAGSERRGVMVGSCAGLARWRTSHSVAGNEVRRSLSMLVGAGGEVEAGLAGLRR